MTFAQLIEFSGNHPLLIGGFVFVATLTLVSEIRRRRGNSVDVNEAIKLINQEDAQLIDLRDSKDFQSGYIVGAKNLPVSQVDEHLDGLKLKTNSPVLLVCQMGSVSAGLAAKFTEKGFSQVYHLKDGVFGWNKAKLPLHQDKV